MLTSKHNKEGLIRCHMHNMHESKFVTVLSLEISRWLVGLMTFRAIASCFQCGVDEFVEKYDQQSTDD